MGMCFLDLETTGLQIGVDQIISIAIVADDDRQPFVRTVKPDRFIPPEVEELTGITNEMVARALPLKEHAARIVEYLGDSVIVGFNVHNFDLPILAEEMERVGQPFEWDSYAVIDAGTIFKKKEERTLAAAVQFYCNRLFAEAHDALADALATREVFNGQIARYADLAAMDRKQLSDFSRHDERRADPSGKLVWKDGVLIYNIGKAKGNPVLADTGMAFWMLGRDFPETTKRVLRKALGIDVPKADNDGLMF